MQSSGTTKDTKSTNECTFFFVSFVSFVPLVVKEDSYKFTGIPVRQHLKGVSQ